MKTILLFIFLGMFGAALAGDMDKRQVLKLSEQQRGLVLEEMRALLSGTQNILAALSKDDMAAVAQQARALGMSMAQKSEDHLKGSMPETFMQLGMSVHQDFDRIAADAEALKDSQHTLRQLSESMNKCVACHDSYQIQVTKVSPKPKVKP